MADVSQGSTPLPSKEVQTPGAAAQGYCQEPKLSLFFCSTDLIMCSLSSEWQTVRYNSSFVAVLGPGAGRKRQSLPVSGKEVPSHPGLCLHFIYVTTALLLWYQQKLLTFFFFLKKEITDNSWKIERCYGQSHKAMMEHSTDRDPREQRNRASYSCECL